MKEFIGKFNFCTRVLIQISINYEKAPFEIGLLTPLKWGNLAKLLYLLYKGQATENELPSDW